MVNDLEHAWLAVDRQAIEAARRSGRAKRQRRRPAAPAAELHPDEPPSPWRLLIIGPVSREAGSRPSHLFPRRFRSLSARIGADLASPPLARSGIVCGNTFSRLGRRASRPSLFALGGAPRPTTIPT